MFYSTLILFLACVLFPSCESRRGDDDDIGNGCSASDVAWFNNLGSQLPDLVTRSQNSGDGNSDELIAFIECNFLSNVSYTLQDPETGSIIFNYDGTDEILNGNNKTSHGIVQDTADLLNGLIWLWGTAGYATCNDDDTATWIFRSGDNLRGDNGVNVVFLSRSTYTFTRVNQDTSSDSSSDGSRARRRLGRGGSSGRGESSTSEEDTSDDAYQGVNCSNKWKISNVFIEVLLDPYIIYNTNA